MGIASLLQFKEAAAFGFIGPTADGPQKLGMLFWGNMQAAGDGFQQPMATALGKIPGQEGFDWVSGGSGGRDFNQRFVTNDEVRRAVPLDGFRLPPLP